MQFGGEVANHNTPRWEAYHSFKRVPIQGVRESKAKSRENKDLYRIRGRVERIARDYKWDCDQDSLFDYDDLIDDLYLQALLYTSDTHELLGWHQLRHLARQWFREHGYTGPNTGGYADETDPDAPRIKRNILRPNRERIPPGRLVYEKKPDVEADEAPPGAFTNDDRDWAGPITEEARDTRVLKGISPNDPLVRNYTAHEWNLADQFWAYVGQDPKLAAMLETVGSSRWKTNRELAALWGITQGDVKRKVSRILRKDLAKRLSAVADGKAKDTLYQLMRSYFARPVLMPYGPKLITSPPPKVIGQWRPELDPIDAERMLDPPSFRNFFPVCLPVRWEREYRMQYGSLGMRGTNYSHCPEVLFHSPPVPDFYVTCPEPVEPEDKGNSARAVNRKLGRRMRYCETCSVPLGTMTQSVFRRTYYAGSQSCPFCGGSVFVPIGESFR